MVEIVIKYSPHEFQRKFHNSSARIRLMLAGIRGGKTLAGVNEGIKLACVGWKTFKTPNRGCVLSPTYPMLRDVVLPEFFKFCPKEALKEFNHSEMRATFVNGSEILFRTADDPERLRGLDLHWFFADELAIMKRDAYIILLGRIAQKQGCGFVATTPKGRNFVYTDIYEPFNAGNKDYDVVAFRSFDNPYFPKEEIERLKTMYSAEFFAQELEAQFISFSGMVYKDFSRARHISEKPLNPHKYRIVGIDQGFTNPTAFVFFDVDHDNNFYAAEEFYQSGLTDEDIVEAAFEANKRHKVDVFYCDPSSIALIAAMRRAGLTVMPANNDVEIGIRSVTERLRMNTILISPRCANFIRELETYRYEDNKDDKTVKEVPLKINDHCCDAARYACMGGKPRRKFAIAGR